VTSDLRPARGPVTILPVHGIGEVRRGDDLARLVSESFDLADGDVVVLTSKVVSKAEGRVRDLDKAEAVTRETDRVVASRGGTRIVRNRLGLTMAGAGVDASNTEEGTVVLLPVDPDASARAFRESIAGLVGVSVAVIVTDTAGRAWRNGQTDISIGAAGLDVLHDYTGRRDGYGNELAVTAPAVVDEVAGAADLVKGKLSGCPAAVVRGLADLVLPPGVHGPGAAALVRDESQDMFGYGAREAVLHAVLEDGARGFGAPAPADVLGEALAALAPIRRDGDTVIASVERPSPREVGRLEARLRAAAYAHGWEVAEESHITVRFRPRLT
jgi:coenzyme F420-0:L-glutamate ligase/coenzyme F420-1:gamma-L-glutamate ligase